MLRRFALVCGLLPMVVACSRAADPPGAKPAEAVSNKPPAAIGEAPAQPAAESGSTEAAAKTKFPRALGHVDLFVHRELSDSLLDKHRLPEDLEPKIAKLSGVAAAVGGLVDFVSFPKHDLSAVMVYGWPADSPMFAELDVMAGGRKLTAADHHTVLIDATLAAELKVKVGDMIPLYGEEFEVEGIFKNSPVAKRNSAVILLSDIREFIDSPHQVTGFYVYSSIPTDAPGRETDLWKIGRRIEALGDGISAEPFGAPVKLPARASAARGAASKTKLPHAPRHADLVVQRKGSESEVSKGLPDDLPRKIAGLPGVSAAMGGLLDVVAFPEHDLQAVIINGWDTDSPLFEELKLEPGGHRLTSKDHGRVLLGRALANDLGVKVGDKISIYGEKVEVAGIYSNPQVYERNAIASLLSDMQRFMKRPHQVSGIIVDTAIPQDDPKRAGKLTEIARQIEALGEGISAEPTSPLINFPAE